MLISRQRGWTRQPKIAASEGGGTLSAGAFARKSDGAKKPMARQSASAPSVASHMLA
jgi:hypothetical protein